MNPEYASIFDARGNLYDAAMRRAPEARRTEFENLMLAHPVKAGDVVIDLPAGGGYLRRHLPRNVTYAGLEIAHGFGAPDVPVIEWDEAWPAPPADHVFCVAALHHFDDHEAAIGRLLSAAKPGGIVHIADVTADSGVSRFLDGFVGDHNGMGHDGHYLSAGDLPFREKLIRCEVCACPWVFENRAELVAFAGGLFGVVDAAPADVEAALEKHVGIADTPRGPALNWSLLYADYRT